MPNYCLNQLIVEAPSPELVAYLKENGLSFGKISPCEETLDAQQEAWGTKWDLSEEEQKEVADSLIKNFEAHFDTAWSPPEQAILALSKIFPNDEFRLLFVEFGDVFCGQTDFSNGEMLESVFIDESGEEFNKFIEEEMGIEPFDEEE
jgi:hypothetical protein